MKPMKKTLATVILVLLTVTLVAWKYWDYLRNPWTRDGQVRAKVVQVAARVSAPIIRLPIVDNQFVHDGDLLFEIDPRTFKANLDEALANYDETLNNVEALQKQVEAAEASLQQARSAINQAESTVKSAEAQLDDADITYRRFKRLVEEGSISRQDFDQVKADWQVALANKESADAALISANHAQLQAQATLAQANAERGAPGDKNAKVRAAKADIEQAKLDLEFTQVRASVDGYVTNLNLRLGTQAVAEQPALALVDTSSFWIDAYFRETVISRIHPGDRAVVTLMGYAKMPISGYVESIGWGIAKQDGSTGTDLLPNVSPTFEWIRLAQRIPVRIVLENVPQTIKLRIGTTASVLVLTGTADTPPPSSITPAPAPLL